MAASLAADFPTDSTVQGSANLEARSGRGGRDTASHASEPQQDGAARGRRASGSLGEKGVQGQREREEAVRDVFSGAELLREAFDSVLKAGSGAG